MLSLARSDQDTVEVLSKALGEREVDRVQRSAQSGAQGISRGVNLQRVTERLALPSELTQLPNLNAYVAFAGDVPVRLVKFASIQRPIVQAAFKETSC